MWRIDWIDNKFLLSGYVNERNLRKWVKYSHVIVEMSILDWVLKFFSENVFWNAVIVNSRALQ